MKYFENHDICGKKKITDVSPNTHLLKMSFLSTFWLLLLPICHEEQACTGRRERFCLRLYRQFEKQKGMHATAACLPLTQPLRQHCFTDLRGNSDFATFLALVLLLLLWRWLLCRNMDALVILLSSHLRISNFIGFLQIIDTGISGRGSCRGVVGLLRLALFLFFAPPSSQKTALQPTHCRR